MFPSFGSRAAPASRLQPEGEGRGSLSPQRPFGGLLGTLSYFLGCTVENPRPQVVDSLVYMAEELQTTADSIR